MPATLTSNSGDEQFVIQLGACIEYAHETGFESSIYFSGKHWEDGDHTFPFSTSIEGLCLGFNDLTKLHERIEQWVGLPLDRLIAGSLDSEFELACLPGQKVRVQFACRPDTISDSNHPVFSLSFSVGQLHGEFHFVTDQSCLGQFAQELSSELSKANNDV